MNISKEQFTKLAKEHLIALESYKMDKNGNKPLEIFGIEKLYEAINYTHCCTELPTSTQLLSDCKKRFKELDKWVFNVETQAGEKLNVIDVIDLKEIIPEIMEVVKKFNYIPCCMDEAEQNTEKQIEKASKELKKGFEAGVKWARENILITEREANDMLESLSRINRQVKMIKEGNTEVKGTGVKRLDIILEKTLLMGIIIKNI